ncbi:MAG: hypothetical protein IT195_02765 [Microthrixaceae bacterium]|nr:hypothetical protein [Microthrixaceae bacterium]
MIRRRVAVAVLLAAVAVAASGCPWDDTASSDDTTTTANANGINPMEEPERVRELIVEHLGRSPEIRRLSIDDNGFTVQVRDAAKPENLDDYQYHDGEWSTRPVSVSMSEIQQYESVTFYLSDISWDVIPGLVDQALDGLDLEGQEANGVSFDRLPGERPRVFIGVTGLRGSGRLIANADGTDVDIQRS